MLVLLKGFDLGRSLGEIFYKRVDNYIYISGYSLDILVFFLSFFFFVSVDGFVTMCTLEFCNSIVQRKYFFYDFLLPPPLVLQLILFVI